MKGIAVEELDMLIKKGYNEVDSVKGNIQGVRSSFYEMRRCIRCTDLAFLTKNLETEISQMNNVVKKANAYQSFLKSVLMSYQYQAQMTANKMGRMTP